MVIDDPTFNREHILQRQMGYFTSQIGYYMVTNGTGNPKLLSC